MQGPLLAVIGDKDDVITMDGIQVGEVVMDGELRRDWGGRAWTS